MGSSTPQSTRFVMKDNEFRLSTINIGYRLREDKHKWLQKAYLQTVTINFTTNDLLRFSTIKMERGLSYPFVRSYTLGLSLMFR